MKKVLILKRSISPYNVPVYNKIGEHYDLTVAYTERNFKELEMKYRCLELRTRKLGPLYYVKGLRKLCLEYDLICFSPDMHMLSFCLLPFFPHTYKLVNWSIGFRVSYKHPYTVGRKHNFLDEMFQQILKRCDSSIFYMEKAKEFWRTTNLDMDKVFVAPNTSEVINAEIEILNKKDFLFIGTLYAKKGVDMLLSTFHKVLQKYPQTNTKLHIVGDGGERQALETFVSQNGINNNVIFHGAIYEEEKILRLFQQSLLCFSPYQAGLSVPKSMGYGVPFVTRKDAITGGEIYHINNGVNGIMYEKDEDLESIMEDAIKNSTKYVEMGKLAQEYYRNHATIAHMAQGAMNAFEYALLH